jgi:hypothetical protein
MDPNPTPDPTPFFSDFNMLIFFSYKIPTRWHIIFSHKNIIFDPNFFLQHLQNKIVFNFVKFVATKNGVTTNFFHPSLLLLFLDPGSGIRDPRSGIRNG